MFACIMGGKTAARSPRSAAVLWKIKTRWLRFPVPGRGRVVVAWCFSWGHPDERPCLEVRMGTRGPTMKTKCVVEGIVCRATSC